MVAKLINKTAIATTIWICLFLFAGIICYVSSCGYDESSARTKCYNGQIGVFRFDLQATLKNNGRLGTYEKDTTRLKQFRIVFSPDSTFYTNMRVDFLDDTVGRWNAGDCGFEGYGTMTFPHTPATRQFGPCHEGDNFFTILGVYHEPEGSIGLSFRKMR